MRLDSIRLVTRDDRMITLTNQGDWEIYVHVTNANEMGLLDLGLCHPDNLSWKLTSEERERELILQVMSRLIGAGIKFDNEYDVQLLRDVLSHMM